MHVRLLSQAAWLFIVVSLLPACQSAPLPAAVPAATQPAAVPAAAVPTTVVPAATTTAPRAPDTPSPSATPAVAPPTSAIAAATATPTVRPTNTSTAQPTATPTVRPTNVPTTRPTATPTTRPTATPSPTPEAKTRTLYGAQLITHGGRLPAVLGDKGDDYLNTAERFPQGCRIVSIMAIEYTGEKPSAPAPSATHAGHGWSVVRQNDDPRDIGVHLHWWFNPGFGQMKLRLVYVVRQDWNADCAIPGKTQDGS